MALDSKIEWCHDTRSIWHGCDEIENNPGCDHCYAKALSHRWGYDIWGHDKPRREIANVWDGIMASQKLAVNNSEIRRVFVGSMMDIFEKPMPLIDSKKNSVEGKTTGDLRNKFFNEIVPQCPNLLFLLLTKRPTNMMKYMPEAWKNKMPNNIMIGTSISTQKNVDEILPAFSNLKCNTFLSIEPLIEEVTIKEYLWRKPYACDECGTGGIHMDKPCMHPDCCHKINWVIVGGESGPNRRPFNLQWARTLRDECAEANVPFFFKQIDKVRDKKDGIPEDLMVREFPVI